jgi:CubicO group peptidase (beta-lactamase class C family)
MSLILVFIIFSTLDLKNVISASPRANQAIDFTAIDTYIQGQMGKHGLKGVSLAITEDDQIVYLQGYGTAGNQQPMTVQTPMYIGSQSKSFAGLAIAQLIQAGKIEPNSPVINYIPEFKIADPEASQKITINHLLHHVSGLSETGFTEVLPEESTTQDLLVALQKAELTAPIGSTFQYFNYGYSVLSVVIENMSGMTYESYLQEYIFNALDMKNTFTNPEEALQKGLSQGYSRFFGFTVPARQPHRVYDLASGYLISTAEDMAHFSIALLNNGVYEGNQLVPGNRFQMIFQPVKGYGMGWFIGADRIYHGGANETFRTEMELFPDRNIGIVLLTNQGYMMDHFISASQMINGVRAIVLGKDAPAISSGWSVRVIGYLLGALVLGLILLSIKNFRDLATWRTRSQSWSTRKLIWDVAISFIIPTVILVVVFSQIKGFFGTRFNWTYQILMMFRSLPDISILMIVGSVPDYIQGFIKLFWALSGKKKLLIHPHSPSTHA